MRPLNSGVSLHMKASCPKCGAKQFRRSELRSLVPSRGWTPPRIACPDCRSELEITGISRFLFVLALFGGLLGIVATTKGFGLSVFFPLAMVYSLLVYLFVWPHIVTLRLARPTFIERHQLDVRILGVVWVIAVFLGVALAVWLSRR